MVMVITMMIMEEVVKITPRDKSQMMMMDMMMIIMTKTARMIHREEQEGKVNWESPTLSLYYHQHGLSGQHKWTIW